MYWFALLICICIYMYTYMRGRATLVTRKQTQYGSNTKERRAHTHRELIREWLGSLRGAPLNISRCVGQAQLESRGCLYRVHPRGWLYVFALFTCIHTYIYMVKSRCRVIGPPSGIPSSGLCFCWLPIFVAIQLQTSASPRARLTTLIYENPSRRLAISQRAACIQACTPLYCLIHV